MVQNCTLDWQTKSWQIIIEYYSVVHYCEQSCQCQKLLFHFWSFAYSVKNISENNWMEHDSFITWHHRKQEILKVSSLCRFLLLSWFRFKNFFRQDFACVDGTEMTFFFDYVCKFDFFFSTLPGIFFIWNIHPLHKNYRRHLSQGKFQFLTSCSSFKAFFLRCL